MDLVEFGAEMNSQWIKVAGNQFCDRSAHPEGASPIAPAQAVNAMPFGQSVAADLFGQFRDQTWLTLSAARLNLPGDRIAGAFGPDHGWTAYGDRAFIDAIVRPLSADDHHLQG